MTQTTTATTSNAYQQRKQQSSGAAPGSAANSGPRYGEGSSAGSYNDNSQIYISKSGPQDTYNGQPVGYGDTYEPPTDHTEKASTQMAWFYSLHGGDLTHLQDQLEGAGLLERGKYGRGITGDEVTRKAYSTLLQRAYYSQQTIDDTLANATEQVKQFGAAGPARQGEIVQLTDPGTIKALADKLIPNVIGRKLTDAELNAAVALYHAAEKAHADSMYAAQGSGMPGGPGGTVGDVQDLSSFLEAEAEKAHPADAQRQGILNTLSGGQVGAMLSGGAPQL